jgi:hypothetical protein
LLATKDSSYNRPKHTSRASAEHRPHGEKGQRIEQDFSERDRGRPGMPGEEETNKRDVAKPGTNGSHGRARPEAAFTGFGACGPTARAGRSGGGNNRSNYRALERHKGYRDCYGACELR